MRMIRVRQLAKMLCVSEKTLYQWAELRVIPSVKLNGSLLFDLDDVEAWVRQCKRASESCYNPLAQTTNSPKKGGKN